MSESVPVIPSTFTTRLQADDVYVHASDLGSLNSEDVQVVIETGGVHVHLLGELDDVQRAVVAADRELERIRAARQDAERNARYAHDLRVISGEHEAINPQEDPT